jgi:hypothetical protein
VLITGTSWNFHPEFIEIAPYRIKTKNTPCMRNRFLRFAMGGIAAVEMTGWAYDL